MIKQRAFTEPLGDVVPQAIFWRPVNYFLSRELRSEDGLDCFVYGAFDLGNWLQFDVRWYPGHPAFTATLYFPLPFDDISDIQRAIKRAIREFSLPASAIGWRRGQDFSYGELARSSNDRLKEPEASLIALKVASATPNLTATTDQVIDAAASYFRPSAIDERPSSTRPRQPQWHQIIRNVISHRSSSNSVFSAGYAIYSGQGLIVTDSGIEFLRSKAFIS